MMGMIVFVFIAFSPCPKTINKRCTYLLANSMPKLKRYGKK